MKSKRLLVLFLMCMMSVLGIMQVSAATFKVTAPEINTDHTTGIQLALDNAAADFTTTLNNEWFSKFHSQTDLARAFGNANAVSSYAGSNQSFQNYDIFSVMVGMTGGFSLPTSLDQTSNMGSEFKKVKTDGDLYIGGSAALAVNVGLKAPFLFDNLYINGKFGYYDQKFGSDFRVQQFLIGFGANYAYIQDKSLLGGLARWRGISLGTGLIYNQSKFSLNVPLSDKESSDPIPTYGGTIDVTDLAGQFSIESSSLTIPFDATTSFQVLWLFNFGVGAGIDLNIPTSTVSASAGGDVSYSLAPSNKGSLSFDQTSESKLEFFDIVSPKLMASLGLNISVVKIDVPFIYYPLSKSFAVGLCAGIVW